MNDEHKYDDIINMPHHVSEVRPQMTIHDRAAQFAPFAALTGYDDAVIETARLTDGRIELDEEKAAALNSALNELQERIHELPYVSVTYFVPDTKKTGGAYSTKNGDLRLIDTYENSLVFTDGTRISIAELIEISCPRQEE